MISTLIKQNLKRIAFLLIISVTGTLISIFIPYMSGMFIDMLVINPRMIVIYQYCVLFMIIMLITIFIGYLNSVINIKVQNKMCYDFLKTIISYLYLGNYAELKRMNVAYMVQRINQDVNCIVSFYLNFLLGCISNILQILLISILLLNINIYMFILVIILNISYWILYFLFKKKLYKLKYMLKEKSDIMYAMIYEQLRYFKLIYFFDIGNYLKDRLNMAYSKYYKVSIQAQKVNYGFISIQTILKYSAQIILFIFGGINIIEGKLSIGIYSIMAGYFTSLNDSLKFFIDSLNSYIEVKVSINRINEIISAGKIHSSKMIKVDSINKIEINNLKLDIGEKLLVRNFNYKFEKGKSYCICGRNGSGKTTLIETIMGLMNDNYKGQILYNDTDIRLIDTKSLMLNCISYLPQEVDVIEDTIFNNITFCQEYEKNIFNKLLIDFDLKKEIIEGKINNQNSNISGGEKKKIGIIRTMLKKADLYIFDEPLASLDIKAQKKFKTLIDCLKKNAIVIIITHENKAESDFYDKQIYLEENIW